MVGWLGGWVVGWWAVGWLGGWVGGYMRSIEYCYYDNMRYSPYPVPYVYRKDEGTRFPSLLTPQTESRMTYAAELAYGLIEIRSAKDRSDGNLVSVHTVHHPMRNFIKFSSTLHPIF